MNQVGLNSRAARWLLAAGLVAAVAGLSVTYLTTAAAQTVSATTPRCHTRGLAVWLGVGNGGAQAGSNAYPVEFTNISGTRCQLYGYPGVSAQLGGQQAGSPARRNRAVAPRTVTLAAGGDRPHGAPDHRRLGPARLQAGHRGRPRRCTRPAPSLQPRSRSGSGPARPPDRGFCRSRQCSRGSGARALVAERRRARPAAAVAC